MKPPPQVCFDGCAPACSRFGWSWVTLATALAVHVTDEALTDFLSVYNPAVHALRARIPWLPLPTFSFGVWLAGLALGIAVLFALSPLAFRGNKGITRVALPFSALMIGNGLGHLGGSIYLARLLPGVCSSPFLIAAAAFTFVCALRLIRARRAFHRDTG